MRSDKRRKEKNVKWIKKRIRKCIVAKLLLPIPKTILPLTFYYDAIFHPYLTYELFEAVFPTYVQWVTQNICEIQMEMRN